MGKLFTAHQGEATQKHQWKDGLTFLGHVVHAVGHRRALLLGVQGGEASVVVHKVVVCKKEKKKKDNNVTIRVTQVGQRISFDGGELNAQKSEAPTESLVWRPTQRE